MKFILFFILVLTNSAFAIVASDIEGTWYRTYSSYKPWTDDNDGTFSFYEEDLVFHKNGTLYTYRGTTKELFGKSLYKLVKKDEVDFMVLYTPEQDPSSAEIQRSQGFYISISEDKEDIQQLKMLTVAEYIKNKKAKKKLPGILYKKVPPTNPDIEFIQSLTK